MKRWGMVLCSIVVGLLVLLVMFSIFSHPRRDRAEEKQLAVYKEYVEKMRNEQEEYMKKLNTELARVEKTNERVSQGQDRFEKLLQRWEKQADRYDAILNKWEKREK
jgi:septal ring factor EnvC (AmiA/AmiB activator)